MRFIKEALIKELFIAEIMGDFFSTKKTDYISPLLFHIYYIFIQIN
jgi:hypothetical protein